MRVLVTSASKNGGTAQIARTIADELRQRGFVVVVLPAQDAKHVRHYDAVIAGSAIYKGRWRREATNFLSRNANTLNSKQVWLFSSGPLDQSANKTEIPPLKRISKLMASIGCTHHKTFGGRLDASAKGLIAHHMAKRSGGDFRDENTIRSWAASIAADLFNSVVDVRNGDSGAAHSQLGHATAF